MEIKKIIVNMTALPCVHHFLNLNLLALHSDFALSFIDDVSHFFVQCSVEHCLHSLEATFSYMDNKKTHLALADTYFLLVALSGGLPVSIGSGRLSSLVLQENEGISKRSDTWCAKYCQEVSLESFTFLNLNQYL